MPNRPKEPHAVDLRKLDSGRWQARVSYYHPDTGRARETSQTFATEREGKNWLKEKKDLERQHLTEIPLGDLREYQQRVLANCQRLAQDAELLLDHERYGSATFLALAALEEVTKAVWCLTWIGTGISQSKTVKINQDQWTAYVLGKSAKGRKSVHQARLNEAVHNAILLVVPMLKPSKISFSEEIADELDTILQKYPRILDLYHTLIIERNRRKSDEPVDSKWPLAWLTWFEKFLAGDENWDLRTLREQAIYTDWVIRSSVAEWQSSPDFVYNLTGLARLCSTYIGLAKHTDFPLFWESARLAILSDRPIQIDSRRKPE